eukprot:2967891-Prymnesium_polylepis.1
MQRHREKKRRKEGVDPWGSNVDLDLWIWIYGSGSDLYGKGRVKGNKNCLWTKANSNMDANLVNLLGSA